MSGLEETIWQHGDINDARDGDKVRVTTESIEVACDTCSGTAAYRFDDADAALGELRDALVERLGLPNNVDAISFEAADKMMTEVLRRHRKSMTRDDVVRYVQDLAEFLTADMSGER